MRSTPLLSRRPLLAAAAAFALGPRPSPAEEAVGIDLEGVPYPYPVAFLTLEPRPAPGLAEPLPLRMAFMDVPPASGAKAAAGETQAVLLLHGRNFPASYFAPVIAALTASGFRVIAPDQIGFGKSAKPLGPWHFDTAVSQTLALLDHLGLERVAVLGHSMGGMLALRLARTAPDRLTRLALEGPLGLENYRLYVPPIPYATLYARELALSAEDYRRYLVTTYGLEGQEDLVEPYVQLRERMKGSAEYPRWVACYVASYYAIWGEPVVDEIPLIRVPTLFLVGERDHTAPGRAFAAPEDRPKMGHMVERAEFFAQRMADARVARFAAGHLIHLEKTQEFNRVLIGFLTAA